MPPEKSDRKIDKFAALDMGFSDTERSMIDIGETLWNAIGRPTLDRGEIVTGPQRIDIPLNDRTMFTAERGKGLYGQFESPGWNPEKAGKDLRFTLSRFF